MKFRLIIRDLQDAYTVTPSGDIRLHAAPPATVRADETVEVAIAEGPASAGRLTARRSGQTHNVVVRADNSLGGATILTGLPFGYTFLPREGAANAGQTWRQDFPAPEGGQGARAAAAYRYTFRGTRSAPGCADCVEIEIQGLRRFLAGPGLDRVLSPNTVYLSILIAFSGLIGGNGLIPRGRSGKLLIFRFTPRGLRRLRLETTRSCGISSSTFLWNIFLR